MNRFETLNLFFIKFAISLYTSNLQNKISLKFKQIKTRSSISNWYTRKFMYARYYLNTCASCFKTSISGTGKMRMFWTKILKTNTSETLNKGFGLRNVKLMRSDLKISFYKKTSRTNHYIITKDNRQIKITTNVNISI